MAVVTLWSAGLTPLAPAAQAAPLVQEDLTVATSAGSALDAGMSHACGIRAYGVILCWGDDSEGQTGVSPGPYVAVSAGGWHTCGLKNDGTITCWGDNTYGQAPASPAGTYTAVSTGFEHTCALKTDGSIACWGRNNYGQAPASPPAGPYAAVSAGYRHTCGLKANGTIACWGSNTYGEAPASTPGLYVAVSAGVEFTCGLNTDSSIACWGHNDFGQAPTTPPSGAYTAVSAGGSHACALRTDGTIVCWGNDSLGQAPATLAGSYIAVSAGDLHTCALQTDGRLACWGDDTFDQASPPPGAMTGAVLPMVSAAAWYGCAISVAGALSCWGDNEAGQAPAAPTGTYTTVSAGGSHTCALRTNGTIVCWGGNTYGQLNVPTGTYVAVSAGGNHTCAIRADGSLTCWGGDTYGEAPAAPAGSYTAVSSGMYDTCAIETDGDLACWGRDDHGQASPPGGTYVAVSTGGYHGCAIETDGDLACWGSNTSEQTSAPAGTYVAVSAEAYRNCAIASAGTLACWGMASSGVPTGTYTSLGVGIEHACAVSTEATIVCWGQNLLGEGSPPPNASGVGATYFPLTPNRLVDSKLALGLPTKLTAYTPARFQVTDQAPGDEDRNVPSNATAVTGVLTVKGPTAAGYLSLTTVAVTKPSTSTLNFTRSDNRSTGVTVPLTVDGGLWITYGGCSSGNKTDILFDVSGYFVPGTTGSTYVALTPNRILDSRPTGSGHTNIGLLTGLTAGAAKTFQVTNVTPGEPTTNVPAEAIAVTGTLTVTVQGAPGFLTLEPDPLNSPPTASLYFPTGDNRATGLTVMLGDGGTLSVTFTSTTAGAKTDVLFDVNGYFVAGMSGATYVALTPNRLVDTRAKLGLPSKLKAFTPGTFQVTGRVPSDISKNVPSYATGVTGTLTVTNQTAAGYLSLTTTPIVKPDTSTMNFPRGDNRATGFTVPLGSGGRLSITYGGCGSANYTDVIFDVTGYFVL